MLLPYSKELVPTYHSWMTDPEMLALTCSEPLSLAQEYANQISWGEDPTKYCFIIHSRRPVITTFREGPGIQTGIGVDYTLASEQQAEEMKKPVPELQGEGELADDSDDDLLDEEIAEEAREVLAEAAARLDLAGGEASERIAGKSRRNTTGADEQNADSSAAVPNTGAVEPAIATSSSSPQGAAAPSSATASSSSSSASAAAAPSSPAAAAAAAAAASSFSGLPAPRPAPYLDRYPLTPIGDLNLFLHDDFNLSDYGIAGGGAEIEIMIALERYRKRGLGHEALVALMSFARDTLGIQRFVVKILRENTSSIALFEKKLGFRMVEYVEVFDEMVFFKDMSEGKGFGGSHAFDTGEEGERPDDDEEEEEVQANGQTNGQADAEGTTKPADQQAESHQPSSSSMPTV